MTDAPERLTDERLDELERLTHVRNYYIPVAIELLASLIAEVRAARAPVAGVVTMAQEMLAKLSLALQFAYENGYHEHGVDLIKEVNAALVARAAPPADEVAGLLGALAIVKRRLDIPGAVPWLVVGEAYGRIENHLKGKR